MKKLISTILISLFFCSLLSAEKPIVREIEAHAQKSNKITITWVNPKNPDEPIKYFCVYRTNQIITDFDQIKDLTPIIKLKPNSTGYTDTVKDFKNYYYAVIAFTTKPYDLVLTSVNSTATGAQIKMRTKKAAKSETKNEEKLVPEGSSRETPLPYIDYIEPKQESLISQKTMESIKDIISSSDDSLNTLTPYYFEEDLVSPDGGDDFLLFQILKTTFAPGKYSQAITQLKKLTGTNISENTLNRALFYLGQSQYMLGKYDDAVHTFVKLQGQYPELTKKWIDYSLDKM